MHFERNIGFENIERLSKAIACNTTTDRIQMSDQLVHSLPSIMLHLEHLKESSK